MSRRAMRAPWTRARPSWSAFKPETDDMREAPALVTIEDVLARGGEVVAFDPATGERARAHFGGRITLAADMCAAAEGADALALVTEWHQFRRPDFVRLAEGMRGRVLFDGRNMWHGPALREQGFTYCGIGREVPRRAALSTEPAARPEPLRSH